MESGKNIMHTSEVSHVKTVEEFYKSIREQQEVAHGKEYCDQHDAIINVGRLDCRNFFHFAMSILQPLFANSQSITLDGIA